MKDIQSEHDPRRISIKKVGVKDISYPITLLDKEKRLQHTVARVNMYVNLPHQFKGTHMSRFVEVLNQYHGEIHVKRIHDILVAVKERLLAEEAHFELDFPYFLRSADGRMQEFRCRMHGSLTAREELTIEVEVPVVAAPGRIQPRATTLPPSLGRWGLATVAVRYHRFVWLEDIINRVEEATARCLREVEDPDCDEELTVERLTSMIGEALTSLPDIRWFQATVENFSAGYSTFATLEWPEH
ncbi:MAG: GTP cyclohydrolase, FolE2/MptA family [Thermodesulfobacteriota bacterium]